MCLCWGRAREQPEALEDARSPDWGWGSHLLTKGKAERKEWTLTDFFLGPWRHDRPLHAFSHSVNTTWRSVLGFQSRQSWAGSPSALASVWVALG